MKIFKVLTTILIIIIIINIVLTGFLEVSISRPIIYYEYLFLPVVLILVQKHIYRIIILMGLILLDIFYNLSHLYFFDLFNYVEKLPYLFTASFGIKFWIFAILGLFSFVWICNFLITLFESKLNTIGNQKYAINIFFSISVFIIIYIVDMLNGSSLIFSNNNDIKLINIKTKNQEDYNIGKSLIRDLYTDYKLFTLGEKQVHQLSDFKNLHGDSSLSYKYFYNSNGNKEVLIVLESWGWYLNDSLYKDQIAPFYKIDSSKYKINFERSYFNGATLQAESRELLNKEGEAYFSVIKHNNCDIKSLIHKKVDQNYQTLAVQSFDGSYSMGAKFKKLIGFQDFKEYKFFHDTLGIETIYNNQYQSVLDEELFAYTFDNLKKSTKNFTYCLTINTHLPFRLTNKQKQDPDFLKFTSVYKNKFPTEQSLDRYFRMSKELSNLASLINKSDVDKVLIIGDHPPPFIYKVERNLFLPNIVPAIIIEKRPPLK
jgi:hypothetical protein